MRDTYPETYDEDNLQRIISYDQRSGKLKQKPVKFKNLLQKDHWLNGLREDYNKMDFCKQSGRVFNGSDPVVKNVEGQQFKDPNQVYQSKYTMESSYIYIISKVIGESQYYKVGEGGSGDKTTGAGRLGDAQTFLPFGLNGDVGYRVHYLFFFAKRLHPNVPQFLNKFIEMRLHSNLRANFRSASITFANGRPSEWYLVPKKDLCIFVGFIFDLVSSYKIVPLQIWKLVSTEGGKEILTLNPDWETRMMKNPDNVERDDVTNIGSNIVVKMNYREEVGSVAEFKNHLLGDFVLQNRNVPMQYSYTVIDIIFNSKTLQEGQPLQVNKFYGIVTSLNKTFEEIKDIFFNHKQQIDISSFEISLNPQEEPTVTAKFYIDIKNLLLIHKLAKYSTSPLFNAWPLKKIFNYYHGNREGTTDTYVIPNNFVAPPWYFNSQIQVAWAIKMTTEEDFMYYSDYLKDYNNNSEKCNWKSTAFYTEQFLNSGDYVIERQRVNENNEIIPNSKEIVPILRVMKAMSIHEIKPTGKKPKKNNYEKTIDEWKIHGKRLVPGSFVELKDDYFTYYNITGDADDISNHRGKTMYVVKKMYEKTNHSAILNPWMDIQQFPPTKDKTKWCILLTDFTTDELKDKIVVKATKESEIKAMKLKLLKQADIEDKGGLANEMQRVAIPLFSANDIIRMRPDDSISDNRFGEEETKRDAYHYVKIIKKIKEPGNTKAVQYEIAYFPPWDKNEFWGLMPKNGNYVEKHRISQIDEFAEKVKQTNEEFKIYRDNLQGEYVVESIVDHYPKYEKLKSHAEFITKAQADGDVPLYFIKWEGFEVVDKDVKAVGLYEDLPAAVKEYWKRSLPFRKIVTRSETRRLKKNSVAGGGRTYKKKKKSGTMKKRKHKKDRRKLNIQSLLQI
jgi:hypothetical protein